MKRDIVGLIYTGERIDELRELTRVRAVAALPMLGRYRMIDFLLSSMIHSDIENIGIIMQKNYHSLMDHLGSGREWDLHGKRSGMTILPPYMSHDNIGVYEGLLDALRSNISFLRKSKERYIAVTDSYVMYAVGFDQMLESHLAMGADLTLLYTKERGARRNGKGRYLDVADDGTVYQMECDPTIPHYGNTYIGAFIARRELLIDLVDRAVSSGFHHFSRELLMQMLRDKMYKVCGYECPGRVWLLDSVESYFDANMEFLNTQVREKYFSSDRPVWTKLRDEMPARYAPGADVGNSLVADGCIIEGKVENAILFRGVTVKPGAVVKNCIVMQDSIIYQKAELEHCILDKQVTVREGTRMIAPAGHPIVIAKNLTL
ncbi:MAG: glucose-1-phosphate adenylyltransferase subunit GlgD [Christensenellales bacterium]